MAFDLGAQLNFTTLFGSLSSHTTAFGEAMATMCGDISPRNIAAVRASMQRAIKVLDELETIAASGTVITNAEAAKFAIEKLLPKLPPKLTIV